MVQAINRMAYAGELDVASVYDIQCDWEEATSERSFLESALDVAYADGDTLTYVRLAADLEIVERNIDILDVARRRVGLDGDPAEIEQAFYEDQAAQQFEDLSFGKEVMAADALAF